jgi:hypothetical protein
MDDSLIIWLDKGCMVKNDDLSLEIKDALGIR